MLKKNAVETVAVFGSAFNPPHIGHLDVIEQCLLWANKIIVVPSYAHAFGKRMAPYEQRLALTQALVGDMAATHVTVSDIERSLATVDCADKPIYTYDVLDALQQQNQQSKFIFVVGPDNADPSTWQRFYRADDILQRWGIWAAQERVAVRSTHIRSLLARGEVPGVKLCTPAVSQLLQLHLNEWN